ncbi:hypothetical protein OFR22_13175 [Brachyspira hyodysenteriae]|uniref:Uncharacterized protein n=1 Tax=Brachyspira innocens TaxID=13264 RepID=A0ABT8YTQ7_9SPIR|nr:MULTISPECIES: hypothetical protein [Brachyspira]MCZ9852401.1 hypothetical protein [Brachyspira hyodysenteriae]MCZ9862024.1 hypothetical protein [Brachyspira hyodysenteriae]MCZ9869702.1 hypothetical protein [Brachyspira hyodysenteriae]MCZ9870337.1 hypothetical protein [Brachyspira hyodysenteriae]MCZ9878309.1 hypothetical protein [Brachyspira hyodysenteriae]
MFKICTSKTVFKSIKQLHSYLILQNKDTLVKILSDLYKLDEDNSIKNYNTEELINFILDYFKNNYDL